MEESRLSVYNTLSRAKEAFRPQVDGEVRMYVCGPTVYDLSHVGHGRKEVVFDAIVRYLRLRGFRVRYIRNVTDVDDKIIQRAQQEGTSWKEIAERYEEAFRSDVERLGTLAPDVEPRATETIPEMQELIQRLFERGYAYASEGSVYFSVGELEGYGKLSHRKIEEMVAGARVEPDEAKRYPLDFALWKASKPGEPSWPSPWGEGRPGWHIECSAMSRKLLGETLDIHGGGVDLVFPHHENEIAQSEAATGKPYCRYWIHNGLLTVEKEKMAKSLGNFVTIREALEDLHPETIRMFFLSHHYRSPVDYSAEGLSKTRKNLDYFYNTLLRIEEAAGGQEPPSEDVARAWDGALAGLAEDDRMTLRGFHDAFHREMEDDFNTAGALGELFRAASAVNRWIDGGASATGEDGRKALRAFRARLREVGGVLGLFREEPSTWFRQGPAAEDDLSEAAIEKRIQAREAARKARDFDQADAIRDELANLGVLLEDTPQGTRWKRNG